MPESYIRVFLRYYIAIRPSKQCWYNSYNTSLCPNCFHLQAYLLFQTYLQHVLLPLQKRKSGMRRLLGWVLGAKRRFVSSRESIPFFLFYYKYSSWRLAWIKAEIWLRQPTNCGIIVLCFYYSINLYITVFHIRCQHDFMFIFKKIVDFSRVIL